MTLRKRSAWRAGIVAAAAGVALALSACASGAPGTDGGSDGGSAGVGTGSLEGDGATIVAFIPSTSNSYIKAAADAITSQAEELDYTVKFFENDFDQTEQDQQVQEYLATGEQPAGFIVFPPAAEAATNSLRLLSAVAPVVQFNQGIQPAAEEYVTAYAGVCDFCIGEQAGENALASVERQQEAGATFRGPDGQPNLVEIRFATGYVAGDDREAGFAEVVGDSFNRLATEPVKTPDAQGGFEAASQIIPQLKSQGIDYIYAHSNNVAVGVVQALEQNGLKPGEDVIVVAGDLSGDRTPLLEGKIDSTMLQSPVLEGSLVMRTLAQYIATGEVKDETVQAEAGETVPELELEAPARITYMPNPPLTKDNLDTLKVWGLSVDELLF